MPTFSIITPSFNQARFLGTTLASVERQSLQSYEHLIFDPGSKDGSQDIIKAYAARNPRVRFFAGEDKSQTNAINLGFARATGDVLCWLNSDDAYYDEVALAEVAQIFADHPDADVVYGEGVFVEADGRKLRDAYINRDPDTLFDRFMVSVGILQPSAFIRRRAIERAGPLDEKMHFSFDYEYWVRLLFTGSRFHCLSRKLARATVHDDAKTMAQRGESLRECGIVAKRHYGFVPKQWADRMHAFAQTGADGIIRTSNDELSASVYVERFDPGDAPLTWAHLGSAQPTLSCLSNHPALNAARRVVTSFDAPYFEQGLTLIASIRRHDSETPILVYDNGLTKAQRAIVAAAERVHVIDFPKNLAPGDWYREPKNYVYKNLIAHHACSMAPDGASILWMDAGVAALDDLSVLFGLIEEMGAFFVNHDDRSSSPLRNATFATDSCLIRMEATVREAAGEHICSCLFGYQNTPHLRKILERAYRYSCDPGIALGDKHPTDGIQRPAADLELAAARWIETARGDCVLSDEALPTLRNVFGYFGHRQDQTIFSLLAARYNLPIVSAKRYCRSSDSSSRQSKLNYLSGAMASVDGRRQRLHDYGDAATAHHRGLVTDFEGLSLARKKGAEACAVIGNGPSLRGFDLRRLGKSPTIGLNAAYRHWEKIGWYPTYYACLDLVVGDSHREQILELIRCRKELGISLFLLRDQLIQWLQEHCDLDGVISFEALRSGSPLLQANPITTGSHAAAFARLMGYKRIYLFGIDCNYVERVDGAKSLGGTILEAAGKGPNPNYFFDDYQREGDRYNIPNPSPGLHVRAWRALAELLPDTGGRIYNTNAQSAVPFFEAATVETFVEREATNERGQEKAAAIPPRVLLIDHTRIGDPSATGQLKATLFSGWSPAQVMQLYDAGAGEVRLKWARLDHDVGQRMTSDPDFVQTMIRRFAPELILYRPMPNADALHALAVKIIAENDIPLATWIMDDWLAGMEQSGSGSSGLIQDWRRLLKQSWLNLAIGHGMAEALGKRYNASFQSVANGVDPDDWPKVEVVQDGPLKVRYAGSLAEDMTCSTIKLVAEAIEDLAASGVAIEFEIHTRALWKEAAETVFSGLTKTRIDTEDWPPELYRAFLARADVVVIGYNFDEASRAYTRYSIANKLPECLACGAALLAVGPSDAATMVRLEEMGCAALVTENNRDAVKHAIANLADAPAQRQALAGKARNLAAAQFDIASIRATFTSTLRDAAACAQYDFSDVPRFVWATVDEAAVVARLVEGRRGAANTMIDVGAHFGSSAQHFSDLGWKIHCFEPDADNRSKLIQRFESAANIIIDSRALSDEPADHASFFNSEESTGISGLHPFRSSHRECARVRVATLKEVVAEREIEHIDFLKIDVEGLDLAVLKGVPWDRLAPSMILCEFEDAKTVPLGHDWRDICRFLRAKGYAVYVSEWHPITRYGVAHDWRRVFPYPAAAVADDAWGNILAFQDDPGFHNLCLAFRAAARSRRGAQALAQKTLSAPARAAHARTDKSRSSPALLGEKMEITC